jgi:hypothetical protein
MLKKILLMSFLLISGLAHSDASDKFIIKEEGGRVEFAEPVTLTGTAVARWKWRRLDDTATYTLQLYIITEGANLDPDLAPLLHEKKIPDSVVINLNYIDDALGRFDAIKAIFGEDKFEEILHQVGEYQKTGVFKVEHLETLAECGHRDFYASLVSVEEISKTERDKPIDFKDGCF